MSSIGNHLAAIVNNPFQAALNPMKTFKQAEAAGRPQPITPPAVMPTVDDNAVQQAKMRRIAEMQSRSGRASTIFTGDSDRVGG